MVKNRGLRKVFNRKGACMAGDTQELPRVSSTDTPIVSDSINSGQPLHEENPNLAAQSNSSLRVNGLLVTNEQAPLPVKTITDEFAEIKRIVGSMHTRLAADPSVFTKLAQTWGSGHLWQKGLVGATVIIPSFVLGSAPGVIALFLTSLNWFLLEDHHQHFEKSMKEIGQAFDGLVDLLGETAIALNEVHQKLTVEVDRMKQQNDALTVHVSTLDDEIVRLKNQIDAFTLTQSFLEDLEKKQKEKLVELEKETTEQKQLIDATQAELTAVTADYKRNKQQLDEAVKDLAVINRDMQVLMKEVAEAKENFNQAAQSISDLQVKKQQIETVLHELRMNNTELSEKLDKSEERNKSLSAAQEIQLQKLKDLHLEEFLLQLSGQIKPAAACRTESSARNLFGLFKSRGSDQVAQGDHRLGIAAGVSC